jgi:hypothetical protein
LSAHKDAVSDVVVEILDGRLLHSQPRWDAIDLLIHESPARTQSTCVHPSRFIVMELEGGVARGAEEGSNRRYGETLREHPMAGHS